MPDLRSQNLLHLPERELAFGIGAARGQFDRRSVVKVRGLVEIDEFRPAPPPQQHQALVGNDPDQPGSELSLTLVLIEMRVSLRARILHLVFGVPAVSQKESRQIDALLTMTAE